MLADQVERDGHARNLFEHRERVVAKQPLVVNASGRATDDDQLGARVLQLAMGRLPLKAAFEHLLRVNRDGYSAVELDWDVVQVEGRPWVIPVHLTLVPARRFRIGVQGMIAVPKYPDGSATGETEVRYDDLRLYEQLEIPQGHPLRPGKWVVLKRQPSQVARGGLGRTASPLMMAKGFSFRDWIVLSQRYGIPWPIAKYDETADQATIDIAKTIIQRIGDDGGAAIPKQLELSIEDGVKAKEPMQNALIAYCNNELSKLVNGSTLRNDNVGAGSYGLGDVHDAVAWDEVRGDGEMLSEALDQYISEPFTRFNGMKSDPAKMTIIVEPDLGPVEMMSLAVKAKNELGIEVSQKQIRERTGLREPFNDADKAPGMQVQSFPTGAGGPP